MPLSAVVIKKPYEISFTGNPMPYSLAITPYGATEKTQDIRIIVRILIESAFGSNNFGEVKSQTFYPNDNGLVNFDVRKIVHAYLDFYTPNPNQLIPVLATGQRKRYRVDYILLKDGEIIGSVNAGTALNAIKAGMSYDQWHPKEFFTDIILNKKQPLQFEPLRKISAGQTRFLYWIYPYNTIAPQTVMIDIELNDQTSIQHNLANTVNAGKWGVCCCPAGFNQLKLDLLVPAGTTAISYTIQVKTAGTAIVAPQKFVLEQRHAYNTSQLIYRNSLGGLETLELRGQVDFEADYVRQNIQSTVPPSYFANMVLLAQDSETNSTETPKFKGDTGFLSREATDRLRDFFISPQRYEVQPIQADNEKAKLLPVTLLTKNTKFFSNNENLVTTLFEWLRGYSNEFYTAGRLMPTVRACPALESFAVTQINKNLLQIMYALEAPYDRVKIQIETTLGIQEFYFTGNARTIRQPFNNPVLGTLDLEEITIRAWCVCDELSDPMDLGPVSTVLLEINGNTLPVANNDTYSLAVGYNTGVVLPGSVLANDYDPDGDPIEAIIQTAQASDAGGTYSLTAAGIITYQPPTSVYSGQDFFDYEIREVGGSATVTARVFINVGTVAGGLYAKVVKRNEVVSGSGYTTQISAEFWLDYFADPAGTIPVDVTTMGLTFEVNQHTFLQLGNCDTNNEDESIFVNGTGTKNKFFEGVYYTAVYDPGFPCDDITSLTFVLLPGTGYIVI